jgi:hypothetical protein
MERARAASLEVAGRIGELGLPVFLYGSPGRGPAFFRRGGPEELQRRVDSGELAPDYGPSQLDPAAGAVLVGARRPLIAFNVNLRSDDVEVARAIAAAVRETGGGFPGVRALGLDLPRAGLRPGEHERRGLGGGGAARHRRPDRAEARARGVEVAGSELVGLMPAARPPPRRGRCCGSTASMLQRVLELRLLDACTAASPPARRAGDRKAAAANTVRGATTAKSGATSSSPVACAPRCVSEIRPGHAAEQRVGHLLLRRRVDEHDRRALRERRANAPAIAIPTRAATAISR